MDRVARARLMRAWGIPKDALNARYRPGDRVRVLRGPWADETRDRDVYIMWQDRPGEYLIAYQYAGAWGMSGVAESEIEHVGPMQAALPGFD